MAKSNWGTRTRRHDELPPNWGHIRSQILTRDHHTCTQCGHHGNQVDHINGPHNHAPDNLRTLCAKCHNRITGRQGGTAYRKGHRKPALPHRAPEQHPALKQNW